LLDRSNFLDLIWLPDYAGWIMNRSDKRVGKRETDETPEEYIQEITIGDHQTLDSTIYLAPYDPGWPSRFSKLELRVQQALGDQILRLEHVGSTSIEGLSAKPIIDMLLVVLDSSDEGAYVPALESQGFKLHIREPEWFDHRLLIATDIKVNLHVFSRGCQEVERMLSFRNWLRSNRADRELYEKTKQELAAKTWKYTQHYADAKSAVVEEILDRAMKDT
jgi:GrpB-like predicted nucleotidyltransferase (UPF0157 family)